jgi:uncharacterized protein
VIYLDASALVTFITRRENANELDAFLASAVTKTCTSTIGLVETIRACDLTGSYPNLRTRLLREHEEIALTNEIRDAAMSVPGKLRTSDAIHVASAQQLGSELTALVTYDRRMAEVARDNGLPVVMPGAE